MNDFTGVRIKPVATDCLSVGKRIDAVVGYFIHIRWLINFKTWAFQWQYRLLPHSDASVITFLRNFFQGCRNIVVTLTRIGAGMVKCVPLDFIASSIRLDTT